MKAVCKMGAPMRFTFASGMTLERPFDPEHCVGHVAESIELSARDFMAMARLAEKDIEAFKTAMRQLSIRLPGGESQDIADKISLVRALTTSPEIYDAYIGEEQVGYLRLRGGEFRVSFPDRDGDVILNANARGREEFEDDEREQFLLMAKDAIAAAFDLRPMSRLR